MGTAAVTSAGSCVRPTPSPAPGMGWYLALASVFFVTALIASAGCTSGVTTGRPVTSGSRLTFQERSHEFGQISASQTRDYRFSFMNTGTQALEITDVRPEPPRPGT